MQPGRTLHALAASRGIASGAVNPQFREFGKPVIGSGHGVGPMLARRVYCQDTFYTWVGIILQRHQPFLSYTTFPSRRAVVTKAWGTALQYITSSGVYTSTSTGAFNPASAR